MTLLEQQEMASSEPLIDEASPDSEALSQDMCRYEPSTR